MRSYFCVVVPWTVAASTQLDTTLQNMLHSQPNSCLSVTWILNYLFNLQAKQHILVYSYFKHLVPWSNLLRSTVDSRISWSESRKKGNKPLLNETIKSWMWDTIKLKVIDLIDFQMAINVYLDPYLINLTLWAILSRRILTETMTQLVSSFRVFFSNVIPHGLIIIFKCFLLTIASGSHCSLLHIVWMLVFLCVTLKGTSQQSSRHTSSI